MLCKKLPVDFEDMFHQCYYLLFKKCRPHCDENNATMDCCVIGGDHNGVLDINFAIGACSDKHQVREAPSVLHTL
jgi:hypothetical protein